MSLRGRTWGAELDGRGGARFRVYAPDKQSVEVVLGEGAGARAVPLQPERGEGDKGPTGIWSGSIADAQPGLLYRYRLAGVDEPLADPASRFQPQGVFGPSELVDPTFDWTDAGFPGVAPHGRVVYELHVGTFTPEGTWEAAREHLPKLARLGVTIIELMPVNQYAGERGWGYDGVFWFAPAHQYGRPDDMRRFIDDAHRLGLAVILDVVYNHLGAVGNVLPRFSKRYMGSATTEWGDALNFDEGEAPPMRELVTENVAYWVDEFHVDGFRFDATQSIFDSSRPHILAEATATARAAAGDKRLYIVAENEPQDARLARPLTEGGQGLDALWNDDFHHASQVALTGHREAYFSDYTGRARELVACVRHGFLFQGQTYRWQNKHRGTTTRGLPPRAFIHFLENHDQVANYGLGDRLWTRVAPGKLRALTTLLLLSPETPLLFQGQEWAATARFAYFTDFEPQMAALVKAGRASFLQQFPRYATPSARDRFPDPGAPETFAACRLDWHERELPQHARALALHRDLLELRREDPTLSREGEDGVAVDAAALSDDVLLVRFFGVERSGAEDRLLLVNLGIDVEPTSLAEPLVAPPLGLCWRTGWSSDDPRYGGRGVRGPCPGRELFLPGEAAVLLVPGPMEAS
jgi:maltooligosyltrehalose trehalohydrolase